MTPDNLDTERGGLILEVKRTKNGREGFQPLPGPLFQRLVEYTKTGEAKKQYKRAFNQGGTRLRCPTNPLLYAPKGTASTVDAYLYKAVIPKITKAGKIDLHGLRVTYINFLLESGIDVKSIQTLARHSTLEMTGVYMKPVDEKLRAGVECVGNMIPLPHFPRTCPEREDSAESANTITLAEDEGYEENIWCRGWDLNPEYIDNKGVTRKGRVWTDERQNGHNPGQTQRLTSSSARDNWTDADTSGTTRTYTSTRTSPELELSFLSDFPTELFRVWDSLPEEVKITIKTIADICAPNNIRPV